VSNLQDSFAAAVSPETISRTCLPLTAHCGTCCIVIPLRSAAMFKKGIDKKQQWLEDLHNTKTNRSHEHSKEIPLEEVERSTVCLDACITNVVDRRRPRVLLMRQPKQSRQCKGRQWSVWSAVAIEHLPESDSRGNEFGMTLRSRRGMQRGTDTSGVILARLRGLSSVV
jgi:hypothetical protein